MQKVDIEQFLHDITAKPLTESPSVVSGGDINEVYRLVSHNMIYCLKCNKATFAKEMFATESKGLALLKENSHFRIPDQIGLHQVGAYHGLLLEWIEMGNVRENFWEEFGRSLAEMHRVTSDSFGLDHDNFIGTLSQSNRQHPNWTSFYIEERLSPLFESAYDKRLFQQSDKADIEKLYSKLNDLLPVEPPALLHGDLWSGNYMCDENSKPVLIDPAVYYGHREIDLAMTKLFGGFGQRMYNAYQESFPLTEGWQERIALNQLYPLLVHVNLFGGHYVNQVKSVIQRYL